MSRSPQISICLPVFNAEKFIEPALDSILAQSFSDFELLIADDGSSDGSAQIISDYATKDSRIKYFRNEKNLGAVRNYNACFKRAAGRFIKPFAADDIMHDEHLEKLMKPLLADESIVLSSCARQIIDADGKKGEIASSFAENGKHNGEEIREEALRRFVHVFNLVGEPSCVLFRRELLPEEGFNQSYYHMTDLDLWMQILQAGSLYYLSEPLCYYRKHKGTTTTNNFRSLYYALDFLRLIDRNLVLAEKIHGTREAAYSAVVEHLGRFINHLIDEGQVTLESVSTNLLNSRNPLLLQSGIAQGESERPATLTDEEYFRMLALFALFKSGENAIKLDSTFQNLSAQLNAQQSELNSIKKSRSVRILRTVSGIFKLK